MANSTKPGDSPPNEATGRDHAADGDASDRPGAPRTLPEAVARIDELTAELETRRAEAAEKHDLYLRERAEVENFKRRMQRERAEALRYASEPLLRDLLPVKDNLERAVRAAHEAVKGSSPAAGALLEGVEMVLQQLADVLGRHGVSQVPSAREPFDPSHHEALAHVESDEHAPGTVVDEHLPGYRLHDRLLRAAQVTVAKPSAGGSPDPNRPARG
jgi:molecular chaperone GrpE